MKQSHFAIIVAVISMFPVLAVAQKADVAFIVGGSSASDAQHTVVVSFNRFLCGSIH